MKDDNFRRRGESGAHLEEVAPQEIEREVTAGKEEEGELGCPGEAATEGDGSVVGDGERRWPGLVVEPEEAESAEGDGEENDDLPAEPEHVAGRYRRRWLLHHGASCKQPPHRSSEPVNSKRTREERERGTEGLHLVGNRKGKGALDLKRSDVAVEAFFH